MLFVSGVSSRGQIVGALNEVNEDNEIVGDQPFYYGNVPAHESNLKDKVRFVLLLILTLMVVAGAGYGIFKLY